MVDPLLLQRYVQPADKAGGFKKLVVYTNAKGSATVRKWPATTRKGSKTCGPAQGSATMPYTNRFGHANNELMRKRRGRGRRTMTPRRRRTERGKDEEDEEEKGEGEEDGAGRARQRRDRMGEGEKDEEAAEVVV